MKKGWILLHRKIYTSNDFSRELDRSIFIFLLCQASYEPSTVVYRKKRISLNRGELLITYGDLAKKFSITVQNVRTIIKNLKLTGTLTTTLTRGLLKIRVEKYIQYQDIEKKTDTKLTSTLTNRRNKLNKLNNTILVTKYNNNMFKIKVPIPKSDIPRLKDLKTLVKPKEKIKTEFELASEKLDKQDFAEYVKFRLDENTKS